MTHNPECGLDCVSAGVVRLDNKARHTPGPWRHDTKGNFANAVEAQSGKRHYDGDDGYRTVCLVQACGSFAPNYDDEMANQAANIALIAAAPEMYEALCAVMSDTDDLDLDLLADLSPDTVKLINAALLKAEGRDR